MCSSSREVVFPVHPRTRKNITTFGLQELLDRNPHIKLIEPQGYVDFLALMKDADFVMTDSGGIQEETTALGIPCLTLRTTTERPSTVEIGTNILLAPERGAITYEVQRLLRGERKQGKVPPMWDGRAAERIAEIVSRQILKL